MAGRIAWERTRDGRRGPRAAWAHANTASNNGATRGACRERSGDPLSIPAHRSMPLPDRGKPRRVWRREARCMLDRRAACLANFLTSPSAPLHAERIGALAVDFAIGELGSARHRTILPSSPDEFFFTKIPLPSASTGPNAPMGDVPAAMDAVRATRCFSIQGEQPTLGCSQASKITGSCFTLHIPGEGPRKNGDTHGWLGKLYSE